MEGSVETNIRQDLLKRISFIEGHLSGIRQMVEGDRYCVDILRQTYAVRRAIEKLEGKLLAGHLRTCVVDGIKGGKEDEIVRELDELYDLAGK